MRRVVTIVYSYFLGCVSFDEVQTKYKEYAKKLHPDRGGNHDDFCDMKNEYDYINENHPMYPIANVGRNNFQFNDRFTAQPRRTTPREPVYDIDPKEVERQQAEKFFEAERSKAQNHFVYIDAGIQIQPFQQLILVMQKEKDIVFTLNDFKYLLHKVGRPVHLANTLYKAYIHNKMSW
jgi:DnaJ-class molecular chaperone